MKLKTGNKFILLGIICLMISVGLFLRNYYCIKNAEINTNNVLANMDEYYNSSEEKEETIKINENYYMGKIILPKLDIELPIQSQLSDSKLLNSPCKFSGSLESNLIIAAHNYPIFFGNIKYLKPNDKVIIIDAIGNENFYKVDKTELIDSNDVNSMTNSNYDLSLFTCNYDRSLRITVRCIKE